EGLLRFVHHIARYGPRDRLGGVIGQVDRAERQSDRLGAEVLKAIHQGYQERGTPPDPALHQRAVERARSLLGSADPGRIDLGIDLASNLQLKERQKKLREIVQRPAAAPGQRTGALASMVAI